MTVVFPRRTNVCGFSRGARVSVSRLTDTEEVVRVVIWCRCARLVLAARL